MISTTRIVLIVLIFTIVGWTNTGVNASLNDYHCGNGPISSALSYGLSTLCGRDKLNECCKKHDDCYDANCRLLESVYHSCDSKMGSCIDRGYGFFCRNLLGLTHTGLVRVFGGLYRSFSSYEKSEQCKREERERNEQLERERNERLERERKEQLERERNEKERLERLERNRLQRIEQRRLRLAKIERERQEKEKAERERLEIERIQQIEAEKRERQEMLERIERAEQEQQEFERLVQLERERQEREKQDFEEELLLGSGSGTDSNDNPMINKSQEQLNSPNREPNPNFDKVAEGSGTL